MQLHTVYTLIKYKDYMISFKTSKIFNAQKLVAEVPLYPSVTQLMRTRKRLEQIQVEQAELA